MTHTRAEITAMHALSEIAKSLASIDKSLKAIAPSNEDRWCNTCNRPREECGPPR